MLAATKWGSPNEACRLVRCRSPFDNLDGTGSPAAQGRQSLLTRCVRPRQIDVVTCKIRSCQCHRLGRITRDPSRPMKRRNSMTPVRGLLLAGVAGLVVAAALAPS